MAAPGGPDVAIESGFDRRALEAGRSASRLAAFERRAGVADSRPPQIPLAPVVRAQGPTDHRRRAGGVLRIAAPAADGETVAAAGGQIEHTLWAYIPAA